MLPNETGTRLARTTPRNVPGLRNEIDRLFADFFERPSGDFGRFTPPADLYETDEAYELEMELPGFSRDDVQVTIEQGMLTISGRRTVERAEDENYHLRERSVGRFSRGFSLPASIEADRVEARFDEGLLRVTLPKAAEARTRKIEVDVS